MSKADKKDKAKCHKSGVHCPHHPQPPSLVSRVPVLDVQVVHIFDFSEMDVVRNGQMIALSLEQLLSGSGDGLADVRILVLAPIFLFLLNLLAGS